MNWNRVQSVLIVFFFLVVCCSSVFGQPVSIRYATHFCHGFSLGGVRVTAKHCQDGFSIGIDAVVFDAAPVSDLPALPVAAAVAGPAHCFVLRGDTFVRVDFTLYECGMNGYICSSWVPSPGDSGSAVIQGGAVVGVVSFRTVYRDRQNFGGVSLIDPRRFAEFLQRDRGATAPWVPRFLRWWADTFDR